LALQWEQEGARKMYGDGNRRARGKCMAMGRKQVKLLDVSRRNYVGRGSSVGIVTRYVLEVPGIESGWGDEIFRTRPDRPWGSPSLLYNGHRVFPGGKAAGAWRWPPNPFSADVK
jgi:hypothetical protein